MYNKGFTLLETILYSSLLSGLILTCTYTALALRDFKSQIEEDSIAENTGVSILQELNSYIDSNPNISTTSLGEYIEKYNYTSEFVKNVYINSELINLQKVIHVNFDIFEHSFNFTKYAL